MLYEIFKETYLSNTKKRTNKSQPVNTYNATIQHTGYLIVLRPGRPVIRRTPRLMLTYSLEKPCLTFITH